MRLFVDRVPRDVAHIMELEKEIKAFLRELDEKVSELTALYQKDLAA
jgi:hypothetical protein